mgnify:CR=1 FL=1
MRFDVEVSICIFAMKPMPRKGTETASNSRSFGIASMKPMPRKGTETTKVQTCYILPELMKPMPRKGTETMPGGVMTVLGNNDETHAP